MVVTVATSTLTRAIGDNHNRKSFYGKGRHWLFYSNGVDICFRSSTDGVIWTDETVIRGCLDAGGFSVVFDDVDYIHYAYGAGSDLFYRRGKLDVDGTITWDIEVLAYNAGVGEGTQLPHIVLDSDGYPWIGYQFTTAFWYRPYIVKSSMNDGTWITDAGFPYELSAVIDGASCITIPVMLTGGKIYVLYSMSNETIRGKLYNLGWGLEEVISSSNIDTRRLSAISVNDDICIVFTAVICTGTHSIYYIKRTYGSGWGSEEEIDAPTYVPLAEISVNLVSGDVYVFWTSKNKVKIRQKGALWTGIADWIIGEGDFPEETGEAARVKAWLSKSGKRLGVAWMRGTASPYSIRYNIFNILPASLKSNSHSL